MAVLEGIELVGQHADGIGHGRRALFVFQLNQQALPEIPGAHPGRFEFLHHLQHLLHLLGIGLDAGPEGQVVHEGFDVPPEVSVIVQRADDERGHGALVVGEVAVAQLLQEALGETLLDGEGIVFRPLILSPVVHVEVVGGDVIVLRAVVLFQGTAALLLFLHFGDGDVAGFVLSFLGSVVQDGIVAEDLPDMLFQGLHRHLDQFDGLNLKR